MASPRVYFYCCDEVDNLQEDVVSLAEGLAELGLPFSGCCNYWRRSNQPGDFLIRHDPDVQPDDCDIVVVSYTWSKWIRMGTFETKSRPLPEGLFKPGRRYRTVCMDSHDGHRTISWEDRFRAFDVILRTKLNRRAWHPSNLRPWVLGLNERILTAAAGGLPFNQRRRAILINFGGSHPFPHGARDFARARFEPKIGRLLEIDRTIDRLTEPPAEPWDRLMWEQTGGRFSRAYYERLKRSQAVACFCGELIPSRPFRDPERYLVGGNRAKLRRAWYAMLGKFDREGPRSVQWDSFRFWETLAAGCAAFNLDLAHYGVDIPVMPENWKHYIGIDLKRVDEAIDRLAADPGILERVARDGRAWALQHYSPKAMAQRFLAEVGVADPVAA